MPNPISICESVGPSVMWALGKRRRLVPWGLQVSFLWMSEIYRGGGETFCSMYNWLINIYTQVNHGVPDKESSSQLTYRVAMPHSSFMAVGKVPGASRAQVFQPVNGEQLPWNMADWLILVLSCLWAGHLCGHSTKIWVQLFWMCQS